jgi:ABC-type multidrug transport system ATPase subunit
MFGLDSVQDKKVSTYSHGMQHKLSLALSLLHSPRIIIWDEPMQGLDPQTRYLVSDIIRELYHEGKTVLFSTHYLHDVTELASHVTVMDRGHIIDNTAVNSIHADFSVYFQDLVIG